MRCLFQALHTLFAISALSQLQLSHASQAAHNILPRSDESRSALNVGDYIAQAIGITATGTSTIATVTAVSTVWIKADIDAGTALNDANVTNVLSSTTVQNNASAAITTSPQSTISANGTIDSLALSCYATFSTWRQAWMSWENTAINDKTWSRIVTNTTTQLVTTATITSYPADVSTYKLCDGSPRADVRPATITTTYNYTMTFTTYITPGTPTYSIQQPCTLQPVDCQYLYYNTSIGWDDDTLLGLCGFPAHIGQPCLIGGGPVQLGYFPVTTANGSLCSGGGSTITHTGLSTADAFGTTLTSGSVYLSFATLYAYQEGFFERIGPNFTNLIVSLPSSAISTQCGGWFSARGPGTSLNYADLNYPYPASAYACENRCSTNVEYIMINGTGGNLYTPPPQCSTIWSDFNPILAVPTKIRELVPAWATCSFWDDVLPNFLFDPPIALHPAAVLATPTLPVWATTTTAAAPGSSSYSALQETVQSTSTAAPTSGAVSPNSQEVPSSSAVAPSSAAANPTSAAADPSSAVADQSSAAVDQSSAPPQGSTVVAPIQSSPTVGEATSAPASGNDPTSPTSTTALGSANNIYASSVEITIGSQTFTASAIPNVLSATAASDAISSPPNTYVMDGTTFSAGGVAEVIGGHAVSFGANGFVVDGTSTVAVVAAQTSITDGGTSIAASESASQASAGQDSASQGSASQGSASQGSASQGSASQGSASQDSASSKHSDSTGSAGTTTVAGTETLGQSETSTGSAGQTGSASAASGAASSTTKKSSATNITAWPSSVYIGLVTALSLLSFT